MNNELEQWLLMVSKAKTLDEAKRIAEKGLSNYYDEMDRMFHEMVRDQIDKGNIRRSED